MDLKSPNAVPHPGKGRLVEAFEVETTGLSDQNAAPARKSRGGAASGGKGLTSRP